MQDMKVPFASVTFFKVQTNNRPKLAKWGKRQILRVKPKNLCGLQMSKLSIIFTQKNIRLYVNKYNFIRNFLTFFAF